MYKKIAIISGASSGLGKVLADQILKDSDTAVISVSRSVHESHLNIDSSRFVFIPTDLSDDFNKGALKKINDLIPANASIFFFNNAGVIAPIKKIGELDEAEIRNSIMVNVSFTVSMVNFLIQSFPNHSINFVNISSGAAERPIKFWSLYGSSKAFIKMFFRIAQEENGSNQHYKFHTIDPGIMDTPMQEYIRSVDFPDNERFSDLKNSGALISPESAAEKSYIP